MNIGSDYILALDSSFDQCSVAISSGSKFLYEIIEFEPCMAATRLVSMVKNCLAKANVEISNIKYLVVFLAFTVLIANFKGRVFGLSTEFVRVILLYYVFMVLNAKKTYLKLI